MRFWLLENQLLKRVVKLNRDEVVNSQRLIDEIHTSRRNVSYDLADTLLKLDALTDRLESTLWDMREQQAEGDGPHE